MKTLGSFVLFMICSVNASNILGFFPMPSASHVRLGYEIVFELHKRGHNITMITPYPKNVQLENFREIYLKDLSEAMFKEKSNFFEMDDMSPLMQLIYCYYLGYMVLDETYKDPGIQNLLRSNDTFDLVIMDQFYSEGLLGVAYRFKAPVVLSSSLESSQWTHHMLGNPAPYSYVANPYLQTTRYMTFYQRCYNTYVNFLEELYRRFVAFPYNEKVMHKYIPNSPSLDDLMYNVSLILVNTHISIKEPSPKVPNLIHVAGMHVKPENKTSGELKRFLDNAPNGVIYFSLGSNLKPSVLPEEKRNALLKAFGKLKVNVLWKWDENNLPGQPSNVKIGKWFPQVDILGHPNVRAFITHGGLLSTIEAVYLGVPLIGIPVYADQTMNMARAAEDGYAINIPYKQLTEERLTKALNEILNNPKYKANAKYRAKVMHDRLTKPMDDAIFWIEYVIRYNGAPHLRTAAMNLTWWQIQLLDVLLFYFAVIAFILFLFYFICKKFVFRQIREFRSKTD